MKILLIDDDAFLRDMYATKFGEKGHSVDVAETVETALVKLHENTYDIVLTDVIMPGMNGIELLKCITSENLVVSLYASCSQIRVKNKIKRCICSRGSGYIIKAEMIPSEVVTEVLRIVSK